MAFNETIGGGLMRLKAADRAEGVAAFAALLDQAGDEVLTTAEEVCLVPVPLHPTRLRQRRYNQSALLAAALGKRRNLPVIADGLERTRKTPPQRGSDRSVRLKNVQGAFSVPDRFARSGGWQGRHVVLIDDVLTTGSTLLACAEPLWAAGVARVSALTVARALLNEDEPLYLPDIF